jgi:hypothetical protein
MRFVFIEKALELLSSRISPIHMLAFHLAGFHRNRPNKIKKV